MHLEGYARTWAEIRFMSGSTISDEIAPHEGLGLPAYVQVAAPRDLRVTT